MVSLRGPDLLWKLGDSRRRWTLILQPQVVGGWMCESPWYSLEAGYRKSPLCLQSGDPFIILKERKEGDLGPLFSGYQLILFRLVHTVQVSWICPGSSFPPCPPRLEILEFEDRPKSLGSWTLKWSFSVCSSLGTDAKSYPALLRFEWKCLSSHLECSTSV